MNVELEAIVSKIEDTMEDLSAYYDKMGLEEDAELAEHLTQAISILKGMD